MGKSIPNATAIAVLVKSRRRCCFCFGWEKDHSVKEQGQIAHIDRNATNDNEDNLAYMCLKHHERYDSKTSISREYSQGEARTFRDELYKFNKLAFGIVDINEERDIVNFIFEESHPVTFEAIRQHVYIVNSSDTRAVITKQQLNSLVHIGLLDQMASAEYKINEKVLERLLALDPPKRDRKRSGRMKKN